MRPHGYKPTATDPLALRASRLPENGQRSTSKCDGNVAYRLGKQTSDIFLFHPSYIPFLRVHLFVLVLLYVSARLQPRSSCGASLCVLVRSSLFVACVFLGFLCILVHTCTLLCISVRACVFTCIPVRLSVFLCVPVRPHPPVVPLWCSHTRSWLNCYEGITGPCSCESMQATLPHIEQRNKECKKVHPLLLEQEIKLMQQVHTPVSSATAGADNHGKTGRQQSGNDPANPLALWVSCNE